MYVSGFLCSTVVSQKSRVDVIPRAWWLVPWPSGEGACSATGRKYLKSPGVQVVAHCNSPDKLPTIAIRAHDVFVSDTSSNLAK